MTDETRSSTKDSVFHISVAVISAFVIWGFFLPENLQSTTEAILGFITETFGWFYLVATFLFLLFAFYLAFSAYGQIRLGDDDDEPDYPYFT